MTTAATITAAARAFGVPPAGIIRRDGPGRRARHIATARRVAALLLRERGAPWAVVAEATGYANSNGAWEAVRDLHARMVWDADLHLVIARLRREVAAVGNSAHPAQAEGAPARQTPADNCEGATT